MIMGIIANISRNCGGGDLKSGLDPQPGAMARERASDLRVTTIQGVKASTIQAL